MFKTFSGVIPDLEKAKSFSKEIREGYLKERLIQYERITYGKATLHDKEADVVVIQDEDNILSNKKLTAEQVVEYSDCFKNMGVRNKKSMLQTGQ